MENLKKYKLGELITQRREKYDGKETLQSWKKRIPSIGT